MRRSSGFTLIELLVAIVAANLFPVLARAREKARQASCLSNITQIGLASLMYAQVRNERLPPRCGPRMDWGPPWDTQMCGYMAIYPYIRNMQIFECPFYSRLVPTTWDLHTQINWAVSPFPEPWLGSYAMNVPMGGMRLAQVQRPLRCSTGSRALTEAPERPVACRPRSWLERRQARKLPQHLLAQGRQSPGRRLGQ